MFFNEEQAISGCEEKPTQIFNLIDEGHIELVEKVLKKKWFSINTLNEDKDDVLTYLLKKGYYELVLNNMKNKDWNVNHQNSDGETFAHILIEQNYLEVLDIAKELYKNKNFIPNIRNKNGQTILDKSLNKDYIYMTVKILKDERFNNIDLVSFKGLYDKYIRSENYGVYSKLNNFETILNNLKDRVLLPKLNEIINALTQNKKEIKKIILNNDIESLDKLVYGLLTD